MKFQPNQGTVSNDDVMTPPTLARHVVRHFNPTGSILEPCRGTGNFLRALEEVDAAVQWCEIKEGKPFHSFNGHVDWIITNPPWSKVALFLRHAMRVADNVVFLMTINHAFTAARIRDVKESGFHLHEMLYLPWPDEFPPSGFQLGAMHWKRGPSPGAILCSNG